jgi:hypothetical protein
VESHHANLGPIVGSVTAAIQEISTVDNTVGTMPSRASFYIDDSNFQGKSGDPLPEGSQPISQNYFNVVNSTINVAHGNQRNIQNFGGTLVYHIHRPFCLQYPDVGPGFPVQAAAKCVFHFN